MPQHQQDPGRLTVLHLVQPVDGGVARVVTDLVRAQVRDGVRAVVACPPVGGLAADAAAVGAEVVPWAAGRSPGPRLPQEIRHAGRLIRQIRPDLVHAHSAKAGLAGRLAVRGRLPTVFQPHAWSFEAVGGATAHAALRWERWAAGWATRVLCVSESERRTGESAGVRARWAVIPNGVDLDRFTPRSGTEDRARDLRTSLPALSGLPPAAPLVVCVGRLCPQKGQDLLLRAWPEITARLPDARLVLVGDGPDRDRLHRTAPEGVLFAGATRDSVPWYRAADVVVQPSRWEGMALSPLEAMACGRPVVMTDVNGARESLPPGQERHCLVPPGDRGALVQALLGLLTDPGLRTTVAGRALTHVRTTYDVRRTTTSVADLYRDVLDLSHPECRERITR
ncbi:glycosyltransferase family 4 protein [Streptomyces sp. H10-C2]|uniref:glycosyltransferase family 4 protein n=1 Tax=unclassified Streptomyces TaxID=2593676 RepID=UPI0024B87DF6|nr:MULTISPECIES: glycosyltransferase family 4 protein [unclassified Streptomyces]MDJ0340347.1 glycosyltransferase family 4 protein [Streptomyces sp. PH10-H1]MDJ0368205.1 glycosyltransferase family 4 protein [Streptomyces sp. H10-C2]